MKTDRARLKRNIAEVTARICALKASTRRKMGPVLYGANDRGSGPSVVPVGKREVLRPGRQMTLAEHKELDDLKARATLLCAVAAITHGKIHARNRISTPSALKAYMTAVHVAWLVYSHPNGERAGSAGFATTNQPLRVAKLEDTLLEPPVIKWGSPAVTPAFVVVEEREAAIEVVDPVTEGGITKI